MGRSVYIFRLWCGFALLVTGFGALAWHLFGLQIVRHEELLGKARQTYTASQMITGQRGQVRDRQGHLLVGNLACQDVLAEPRKVKPDQRERVIGELARLLDQDLETLTRRFSSGSVEIIVARAIPMAQAAKVAELKLPGVRLVDRPRRYYPKSSLLANILGFTDNENRGVFGLEEVWDKDLSPRQMRLSHERDRKGKPILRGAPEDTLDTRLAQLDGKHLYLTIDEPIQTIMERELALMGEEHAPQYAFAIMANPRTGAVMAMAQWPTFDPNDRSKMDPRLWVNHMISDVYDPGSTMKCIAVAGALDYGVITPETKIDCEMGRWVYGGRSLRDSDHEYGRLTVNEVIQHSSNIGTAKIALLMGEKRLYQVFRRFGFGQRTNIGLPDESRGILRATKDWDTLSITRFPIGQGISVTPPQMVQAYGAIANGGELMQLHLVDRIEDPTTREVTRIPPISRGTVARAHAMRQITAAMVRVTTKEGTAYRAAIPGYQVAGKTGTSQKLVDGSYVGHRKYVSSFVGFVPAEDPAFVLLVTADEPSKGKYYGGTVAAPVFKRIAEQTLRYLDIPPRPEAGAGDKVVARRSTH